MTKLLFGLTVFAVVFFITPSEACRSNSKKHKEKYEKCPNRLCLPQSCSQLGFPISCQNSSDDSTCSGKPGYVCINGYVRNNKGVCVPVSQCPACGGDSNAKSGCGINCGRKCSTYKQKFSICPRICLPNACDCKENYVYDDNIQKCVLPEECTPVCKSDEVYSDCINGGCRGAKKCSELGQSIRCVKIDSASCIKGCLCRDGYLRADNGTCVPKNQCKTSCNGDPNAKPGCGVNCGRHCSNYNKKPQFCIQICYPNGCDCKPGYVYDDNIKKCVSPQECSPVCKINEVYVDCIEKQCQPKKCFQKGQSVSCPNIRAPTNCTKGCLCTKGHLRADNGTCVPEAQCNSYEITTTPSPQAIVNKTEALKRFNKGSIALSGEFIYQLLKSKPNSSFVASATSLLIPLALIAYYATGSTLEQLLRILNLQNKDEIKSVFPSVLGELENQTEVIFQLATKYYANIKYPLSDDFIHFSTDVFNTSGENINFSQNVKAANKINAWVEEHTNNKIQNLVSPDDLSSDTRIALINAIYFLGNWIKQFNTKNTKTKDFYLDDTNTIQLPIMYQENNFNYGEDNNYQVLELFYKNNNFSFLIILPKQKGSDALKTLAKELRDPDVFTGILGKMRYEKVQVYIPRMSVLTTLDIAEMLKKDNVTEMFNPASDGFKGILKNPEPIAVSAIIQKAFIKVDEKGTEAAAATAIIGLDKASIDPPRIYKFNANHGFLFYLLTKKIPIFCGGFLGKT